MNTHLESEATEAVRDALNQVSVIKLKEFRTEWHGRMGKSLIVQIEIYGHAHTLVCKVSASSDDGHVQRTFVELRRLCERYRGAATPVLIAPELSPEVQALCRESDTGFLDLKGNARLYLEDVFIVRRSLPCRAMLPALRRIPPQAEPLPTSETAHFANTA